MSEDNADYEIKVLTKGFYTDNDILKQSLGHKECIINNRKTDIDEDLKERAYASPVNEEKELDTAGENPSGRNVNRDLLFDRSNENKSYEKTVLRNNPLSEDDSHSCDFEKGEGNTMYKMNPISVGELYSCNEYEMKKNHDINALQDLSVTGVTTNDNLKQTIGNKDEMKTTFKKTPTSEDDLHLCHRCEIHKNPDVKNLGDACVADIMTNDSPKQVLEKKRCKECNIETTYNDGVFKERTYSSDEEMTNPLGNARQNVNTGYGNQNCFCSKNRENRGEGKTMLKKIFISEDDSHFCDRCEIHKKHDIKKLGAPPAIDITTNDSLKQVLEKKWCKECNLEITNIDGVFKEGTDFSVKEIMNPLDKARQNVNNGNGNQNCFCSKNTEIRDEIKTTFKKSISTEGDSHFCDRCEMNKNPDVKNLRDACLTGDASNETPKQVIKKKWCKECNKEITNIDEVFKKGTDFSDKEVTNALDNVRQNVNIGNGNQNCFCSKNRENRDEIKTTFFKRTITEGDSQFCECCEMHKNHDVKNFRDACLTGVTTNETPEQVIEKKWCKECNTEITNIDEVFKEGIDFSDKQAMNPVHNVGQCVNIANFCFRWLFGAIEEGRDKQKTLIKNNSISDDDWHFCDHHEINKNHDMKTVGGSSVTGATTNDALDQENEKKNPLHNAGQNVNCGNEYPNWFPSRNDENRGEENETLKENPISEEDLYSSDNYNMHKSPNIKTLADSVTYFGLSSLLLKLESSIEDVRRNKKSKEDHEECVKETDKEIQKLSYTYHPDKVLNRGGSEKDVEKSQKLQTALNSTRTALKLLNSAFLEDIGTDHKFGFYTSLNIDSLSDEDEMQYRIYEVIFKIGVISRIKQQNIISQIRKFLTESKSCVRSYLEKSKDFEKHRDLAVFHLKCCVEGFKRLCEELKKVKEECKSERNNENMLSLIRKMANDSKRDLRLLNSLKELADVSLTGKCGMFSTPQIMDSYFVLPLVYYTNIILMCNAMVRSNVRKMSRFDIFGNFNNEQPYYNADIRYLYSPYYLALYCSGHTYLERTVLSILGKNSFYPRINKVEIELKFDMLIADINDYMDREFKVEYYNAAMTTNLLALDLKKCIAMMSEFEQKQVRLSKGIEEFQRKIEERDQKSVEIYKMMEEAEKRNQKVKERLEQNRKFREEVSNKFSEKQ